MLMLIADADAVFISKVVSNHKNGKSSQLRVLHGIILPCALLTLLLLLLASQFASHHLLSGG